MPRPSQSTAVFLLVVCVVLTLQIVAPPAGATHQGTSKTVDVTISETVTLPVNSWAAYNLTLGEFEAIEYDLRVRNGTAIDVYFVSGPELANYRSDSAQSFLYYREGTNNTLHAFGTFDRATGPIAVIVDNVDIVPGDAEPKGPVSVSVGLTKVTIGSNLFLGAVIFIACGGVLLGVAFGVFLVLRRRKAPAGPPPPSPYTEPPRPYTRAPTELQADPPDSTQPPPSPPPSTP